MEVLHATAGNRSAALALGGGAPLDESVRHEMQARYSADFSGVRVHADATASQSADDLHANAYAIGSDIVFGPGRYAPHSHEGRRLIAHELAHVVQQSRGGRPPAFSPDAAHERQADRAADAAMSSAEPVSVEGATGVGVAADVKGWFKEKYASAEELAHEAKEMVPEGVREAASDAVDTAVEWGPYVVGGPALGVAVDLQRAAVNDIKEAVTGVDDPEAKGLREESAKKVDFAIGTAKGVATQVTDLADNVVWAGAEIRDAKDDAVKKTAQAVGVDEETARKIAKGATWLAAPILPGPLIADALGSASDAMKDAGLVDEQGKASLTVPVQQGYDFLGDAALDAIGAPKVENDSLFSEREKGELTGAIGIQVAGAFVGATEVKVVLAGLGALGGIRGIVETMRAHPNDFYTQPSFWAGFLATALSLVGLKAGNGAGKKIIHIALQCGALVQVVPHLWQLYNDYNDTALQADPEKYRKTLNRDVGAVTRAVVDIIVMIIRNGKAGKPTPKFKSEAPKSGAPANTGAEGGTTTKPPSTPADASGSSAGATGPQLERAAAPVVKQPSAKAQKKANVRAESTKTAAAKSNTRAQEAEAKAQASEAQSKASQKRAEEQRARSEKNAATLASRQGDAQAKAAALAEAQQKAAAAGSSDAKTQAKLKKSADAADKAAQAANVKAQNAQKRADSSSAKASDADARAAKADARAQTAKADANEARAKAKRAEAKADKARQKAESMRPPDDPQQSFADLNDPAHAAAGSGPGFKPNAEPLVWVRTGKGKNRWTYVPEGETGFGKGKGVAMPKSEADAHNFAPAGEKPQTVPITPREIGGKPVESAGAGGKKGAKFVSASAEDPTAVRKTSITPDIAENRAYNVHIDQGEVGILRPQGSNAPGVDSITARIEFDSKGRPIRAKIFLNDVTTPDAAKGAKESHANWQKELTAALDPKAPPGQRLDFGDPAMEAVIRKAAAEGDVHIRIVRVDSSPTGQGRVSINPGETWRLGPVSIPRLPNLIKPRDEEREPEEQ